MIEEEIFSKAIALAANARSSYLDDACGNDETLRKSVDELIAIHESGSPMFDRMDEALVEADRQRLRKNGK